MANLQEKVHRFCPVAQEKQFDDSIFQDRRHKMVEQVKAYIEDMKAELIALMDFA